MHASNGDAVAAKNAYTKSAELQKGAVHSFDLAPKSALDPQPFAAPLLHLLEVAAVCVVRVVGFLVGQVRH